MEKYLKGANYLARMKLSFADSVTVQFSRQYFFNSFYFQSLPNCDQLDLEKQSSQLEYNSELALQSYEECLQEGFVPAYVDMIICYQKKFMGLKPDEQRLAELTRFLSYFGYAPGLHQQGVQSLKSLIKLEDEASILAKLDAARVKGFAPSAHALGYHYLK